MSGFMNFFIWLWSKTKEGIAWFTQSTRDIPPNESGELIRRYLAYKNWYDQISTLWVEQSFWKKGTIILGVSLFSGLIGLVVGVPTLFALSALFISLVVHTLFVANESHRWNGAMLFSAEAIALNKELEASKLLLEKATSSANDAAHELNNQSNKLKEQASQLDLEGKLINQQNIKLITIIDEAKRGTNDLLTQENIAQEKFELMANDLNLCDQAISQSTTKVNALGDTVSQFSDAVVDIQQSQKKLAIAVSNFCFFNEEALDKTFNTNMDTNTSDLIESLRRQNDEDDNFIEEMKRNYEIYAY